MSRQTPIGLVCKPTGAHVASRGCGRKRSRSWPGVSTDYHAHYSTMLAYRPIPPTSMRFGFGLRLCTLVGLSGMNCLNPTSR